MTSTHRAFPGPPLLLVLLALLSATPGRLSAQIPAPPPAQETAEPVRLYLDCHASGCYDLDYLRTEIRFVDFVRDVRDADVYLLVTSQATGAGGSSSEMIFTGQGRFEGMADTLAYVSAFDATADDMRRGLVGIIKIGLMRYVGLTSIAREVTIGMQVPERGPAGPSRPGSTALPEEDPWDFWVLSTSASGGLSGESSYKSTRLSGSFSASRVTEEWKVGLKLSSSYTEANYTDLGYKNVRREHAFSGSLINALKEKWSLGLMASVKNSTYYNYDLAAELSPVLEYSFFPYSDATRRSLTLQYGPSLGYYDYAEETIYFKTEETVLSESLSLQLRLTRPWGTAFTYVTGAHHFSDPGRHHLTVGGLLSLRIARGLSLSLSSTYSRVHDRISVVAGDATDEEILLRRRLFQTDYSYSTSIGLRYSFGSIFNNIVNPRIDGSSGGIIIM